MHIRLAVLVGVTTAVVTVMIKEVTAEQHQPLTRWTKNPSAQATGSELNQPCGCHDPSESPVTSQPSTPNSGAPTGSGLDLKKLGQVRGDAGAQKDDADRERRRLEGELNDVKRRIAVAQQIQAQKDAQIARLKEQLGRTPTIVPPGTRRPVWSSDRDRIGSGSVVAGHARVRPTRWAAKFFKRPWTVDCIPGVRSLYYERYEMFPF